uniref:Uncharacterized protein n=1 Tax=Plectus sambesii TaxID=2011161 RepID=A0A914UYM8_9BILA
MATTTSLRSLSSGSLCSSSLDNTSADVDELDMSDALHHDIRAFSEAIFRLQMLVSHNEHLSMADAERDIP